MIRVRSIMFSFLRRYKNALVRSDMTVAYGNSFKQNSIPCLRPCCAVIRAPDGMYGAFRDNAVSYEEYILVHNCFDGLDPADIQAFQLCETSTTGNMNKVAKDKALPLQSLSLSLSERDDMMVTCPAGHATRCLMAVDSNTACLKHDEVFGMGAALRPQDPTLSSCLGTLKAAFANFMCVGSGDPLPYTLVCDHRKDCMDNSDEEFCVFPPCTGDTPLKCASNQQVCIRFAVTEQ